MTNEKKIRIGGDQYGGGSPSSNADPIYRGDDALISTSQNTMPTNLLTPKRNNRSNLSEHYTTL